MRRNYKNAARTIIAIFVVSLILMCRNTNAQQGYPPWMRMPPYRPVIVQHPPTQNYRQGYNPYIQTNGTQPLMSFSIHFDPLIKLVYN